MTDYTPPERIYLQTHEDGEEIAEKTHCEDRIHDTDTEYIRADLAVSGETSDGFHTFNELYEFRKLYNAALFNEWAILGIYDVHKSWRHSDGEKCFDGGWFCVVAQLPTGQITNHYEEKDWELFKIPKRDKAAEWDGHNHHDVIARLTSFLTDQHSRADLVDSLAKKALIADNKRLTEHLEAAKRQKTIEEMERALAALKAEADSSNPKE